MAFDQPFVPVPTSSNAQATMSACEQGNSLRGADGAGRGSVPTVSKVPTIKGGVPLWLVVPQGFDPARLGRPLVAVHGIKRDAREQAKAFTTFAQETGRLVIAPHFSKRHWKRFQWATTGNRPDLALIASLRSLEGSFLPEEYLSTEKPLDLFGFSGGAQFSHRFAMMYPALVRRMVVASAGWYTFPNMSAYPLGLSGNNSDAPEIAAQMRNNLRQFLQIPTHVLVGTRDCVIDSNTRQGPDINSQQGRTRLARAQRWAAFMTKAGHENGLETKFEFQPLPGCDHSFSDCVGKGDLVARIITHTNPPSCK